MFPRLIALNLPRYRLSKRFSRVLADPIYWLDEEGVCKRVSHSSSADTACEPIAEYHVLNQIWPGSRYTFSVVVNTLIPQRDLVF